MDFFLLLTALLCGLTGADRANVRVPAVEASRIVAVADAVAPVVRRVAAPRPDGYVAPLPLVLDLSLPRTFALAITPERRRE